ncbi:acyl-CoA synthetase [Frankia gtarii]|uniref:acyl-CoA synthetase n=1 Tax=Frankia gtarii TaxID=2950102 RepID=UPI0021BFF677|nr:acyl-CoA synthetase [Frankia gtarii]
MHPGVFSAITPDKPAVIMGSTGERVSYRELDDGANRLARLLHDRGLRPGDGIALLAENHRRYFEVYWAAIRSGLYLTAVNRHLSSEEAAFMVNDSGSTAFISTKQLAPTALQIAGVLPRARVRLMMDGTEEGFDSYEAAVSAQPATPLAKRPRGDVMLYSAGTTGRPKGIQRPLTGTDIDDPGFVGISGAERGLFGMSETSVYLCPAPLYHSAALQWSAGLHEMGGTLIIMEKFDPAQFLALVERERVTHTQVVPTMLVRLLKLPEAQRLAADVSSLECVIHAAAPCPPDVKRRMIDWLGPIVSEFYGGTEGVGLTFLTATEWLSHQGSVGRAMLGILRICDDDGNVLPTGEIGTVYFERDAPPFEYHSDAEKTRESRHPGHDRWATLGDIGYLDEDGYLYLTDRRAYTIISGGVNIYPAEIESLLIMHPAVSDVVVFGLPHEEMGEYVHAVVQVAEGVAESAEVADELRAYARARLAGYKVPRVVTFRSEIPRLPTGKLLKSQLRDELLRAGA